MTIPPEFQARIDAARELAQEVEKASFQLAADLKYPVDAHGRVLDMNHLPDVAVTLVFHLIRCGWRPDDSKRLIKQRRVTGGGYYEDLVTYVGVNDSDDPIVIDRNPVPAQELWSVKPVVNVVDEPRGNV